MSVYYAIACNECKTRHDFITNAMGGMGWMAGALDSHSLPDFIGQHMGHAEKLSVISEHDPRWHDYANATPAGDDDDGCADSGNQTPEFGGGIEHMRVYERLLSDKEIAVAFRGEFPEPDFEYQSMTKHPWEESYYSSDETRQAAEAFLQSALHSQSEMQRLGVPQRTEHKAAIEAAEKFLREHGV